ECLHRAAAADRELLLEHALVFDGGKIVAGRPVLGGILGAPVDLVGLEGFERHVGVAQVKEAHLIEVIATDVYRQILAPVVLDAFVDDAPAGLEALDTVGAASERRLAPPR